MADNGLHTVLRHVRTLVGVESAAGLPDRELLTRFIHSRDESAFAALVERHGPMVLAVCRRVLRHEQDAEDAGQAAFLVLARTAASIRKRTALGSWLHGVAYRLARKVREGNIRRYSRESRARGTPPPGPETEASWREVQAVLDEELGRLPEKYRAPLVLCYLEGRSRDEAARELGLSSTTLRGRLEQGRGLLRARLARRGVALSAALLVPVLAADAVVGATPAPLVVTTVRAAVGFAAGRAVPAATLSTRAAAWAEGGVRAMVMTKLKAGVSLLLVVAALAAGAALTARPTPREADREARPDQADQAAPAKPPARVDGEGFLLPDGVVARLGSARLRHGGWVHDVCFAPDGKLIASVGTDNALRVWDGDTGKQVFILRRPGGGFDRVAFASTAKAIVVAGHDKATACDLWRVDAATGKVTARLPLTGARPAPAAVRFSHDGSRLAVGTPDTKQLSLFDTTTGDPLWTAGLANEAPTGAAFAADGSTVAVCTEPASVRLFDRDGKPVAAWAATGTAMANVALSPDGGRVVAYDKTKSELHAWDRDGGKLLWKQRHPSDYALMFAPDGRALAGSAYGYTAAAVDAADGKARSSFAGMVEATASAFRPDGKVVAFGTISGTIGLFDAATGKPVAPSADPPHEVRWLRFAADGKTLYGWSADWFAWDVDTGKQRRVTNTGWNYGVPLSPDGRLTASVVWYSGSQPLGSDDDGTRLEIHNAATGALVQSHRGKAWQGQGLIWKDFAQDSKSLVSGLADGTVRAWAVDTGEELVRVSGHRGPSQYHAFSADGRVLVTGAAGDPAEEFPVRVADLKAGKELAKFHPGVGVVAVAVSADGRRVAAGAYTNSAGKPDPREVVVVWDVASGKELIRVPQHGDGGHIALSPDGRTLAVAARWKGEVRVREVASGSERFVFRHDGEVTGLAFAPDGHTLAAASKEAPVYLWDVTGDLDGPPPTWEAAGADRVWDDLGSNDAARGFTALRRLRAEPATTIAFLRERSKAHPPEAAALKKLLADLDASDFQTRAKATATLAGFGEAVHDALRAELTHAVSPESRKRLQGLLDRLAATTPARLRLIRAVEAVEGLATPEAKALLETWAGGNSGPTLTAEAIAALSRRRR
jgi:RNA polymerase sigma factor (sigma-70 family)